MKNAELAKRLAEIAQNEVDSLLPNIILKIGNRYRLFDTYTIEKNQNKTCTVVKKYRDPKIFFTMRSAVAWCIADKFQHYETARSIVELDRQCNAIKQDLEISNVLLGRIKESFQQQIVSSKIASKRDTLKSLEKQLTKCVNLTKYWQIKGFTRDETARLRNTKTAR